jgi:hypothetical protein
MKIDAWLTANLLVKMYGPAAREAARGRGGELRFWRPSRIGLTRLGCLKRFSDENATIDAQPTPASRICEPVAEMNLDIENSP